MKESNNNQFEGMQMPPAWCSGICRNAMNEICIEVCALKRDCSAFEPKPNLKLIDMPSFPLSESAEMTKEEKFTSVTIYLSKVVDHLQGKDEKKSQIIYQAPPVAVSHQRKLVSEVASLMLRSQNDLEDRTNE